MDPQKVICFAIILSVVTLRWVPIIIWHVRQQMIRNRTQIMREMVEENHRRMRHNLRVALALTRTRRRIRRIWKKARSFDWWKNVVNDPAKYTDNQWIEDFRMSKGTFQILCVELAPILAPSPEQVVSGHALTVEQICAIAVYKLSSCAEFRVVGTVFGVHKSTVHNCLYAFCIAVKNLLTPRFIKMPNEQEMSDIATIFENACHIPQLIGAIDGTHIPVTPPQDGHADYINRKMFPSMVLWQAVVDHKFRDISVKCPGSCHDATVMRESDLYKNINNIIPHVTKSIEVSGIRRDISYMIVGDPAYPMIAWLIKNYLGYNIPPAEDSFNAYLNTARIVVENGFGRLKTRWRCLSKKLDVDIKIVPTLVVTCCTLHNICEGRGEMFVEGWLGAVEEAELLFPQPAPQVNREFSDKDVSDNRDHIRDYLLMNFPLRQSIKARLRYQ